MSTADTLLPLGEVTGRLRVVGQNYVGMRTIPIDHIVGSVDRAVDFDRVFRPRNRLQSKLRELRTIDRTADWTAAAACRASEPVTKAHIESVRRERRTPLPRRGAS